MASITRQALEYIAETNSSTHYTVKTDPYFNGSGYNWHCVCYDVPRFIRPWIICRVALTVVSIEAKIRNYKHNKTRLQIQQHDCRPTWVWVVYDLVTATILFDYVHSSGILSFASAQSWTIRDGGLHMHPLMKFNSSLPVDATTSVSWS